MSVAIVCLPEHTSAESFYLNEPKRSVITLSGGLSSGVRLWLARVIHSSKVLMKVAQVALRREACRGRQRESSLCRNLPLKKKNNRNVKDLLWRMEDEIPLRWAGPRCRPCAVTGLFGPAGRGGRSTSAVRTSLSSDSRGLATEARKHTQSGGFMRRCEARASYFDTWKH